MVIETMMVVKLVVATAVVAKGSDEAVAVVMAGDGGDSVLVAMGMAQCLIPRKSSSLEFPPSKILPGLPTPCSLILWFYETPQSSELLLVAASVS